jgi:hypothetical protein
MGNGQSSVTNNFEVTGRDNPLQKILLEVGAENGLSEQERIDQLKMILEPEISKTTSGADTCLVIPNLDDYAPLFEQVIAYATGYGYTNLLEYVLSRYPIVDVSSQDNYCFRNTYTSDYCRMILAKHDTFRPDLACVKIAKNNYDLLKAVLNTQAVETDLLPHITTLREAYNNGNFASVFGQISTSNSTPPISQDGVDSTTQIPENPIVIEEEDEEINEEIDDPTATEMQPLESDTVTATEMQPLESDETTATEMQPLEINDPTATEMQPLESDTVTATEMQPLESDDEMQPLEINDPTATEMQPLENNKESDDEINEEINEKINDPTATEMQPLESNETTATEIQPLESNA